MLKQLTVGIFAFLALSVSAETQVTSNAAEIDLQEIFKLEKQEVHKVAPRDPLYRCKLTPKKPGCPGGQDQTIESQKAEEEANRLKCKAAKTCVTGLLGVLKRFLV